VVWNNNYAAAIFAAFPPELREMISASNRAYYGAWQANRSTYGPR
jgi:hypothetical protein